MNKRILLIGDGNSIFISRYAYWIKSKRPDFQIDIFSTTILKKENEGFYDAIYRIESYPHFAFINKYKGVRRLLLIFIYKLFLKDLKKYDYIHFQFVSPLRFSLVNMLKKRTDAKIILSVWGSDFYKLNPIDIPAFKKNCLKAEAITMANPQTINDFRKKLNWNRENLKECRFGLTPLEYIKNLKETKTECKMKLGWNPDKISVVIGYNASENQQHIEIIRLLRKKMTEKYQESIELIFPISYGGSTVYKEKIKSEISTLSCKSIIYETFLPIEEIAMIRKASDILIQLQQKDQFSGSMQEHLFAGSYVVTGSWLPYRSFREKGLIYSEIDHLNELPVILDDIILNFGKYNELTLGNSDIIATMSLWDNNIEEWLKLYEL